VGFWGCCGGCFFGLCVFFVWVGFFFFFLVALSISSCPGLDPYGSVGRGERARRLGQREDPCPRVLRSDIEHVFSPSLVIFLLF